MSKEDIKVSTDWLTNTLTKYIEDASAWRSRANAVEAENKELRLMRDKIVEILASVHDEDRHGNVKAYKYDSLIKEIRAAVFPATTDSGWTYQLPFDREVKRDLDNLRVIK